jgi:hypothetical protein
MATTTNYSWSTPDDTALVKDGAAAIRSLGTAIDSTVFTNAGAAINKSLVDAAGDLIYGTADNTVARLAIGTANQVLKVNSGATAPEWGTAPSGGMTLISTTTLSGASVSISSIPATYQHLQLIFRNARPATDGVNLQMRFNSDSTTKYRILNAVSGQNFAANNTAHYFAYEDADNGASDALHIADIYDYTNTTTWKVARFLQVANNQTTTTNANFTNAASVWFATSAVNEITLFPGSGNWTSGTVYLYGVK